MFQKLGAKVAKVGHKFSTPFAIGILSAIVGGFMGSFSSYYIQASAEKEAKANKMLNYLTLLTEDLKRQEKMLEKDQLFDKIVLNKFLNWETMGKRSQAKAAKESTGRVFGAQFSTRILGTAMTDTTFFTGDTQLLVALDGLFAAMREINDLCRAMSYAIRQIPSSDYPKLEIDELKHTEKVFGQKTTEIKGLFGDCLRKIELEKKRLPHKRKS